jgi:hypothetical protein
VATTSYNTVATHGEVSKIPMLDKMLFTGQEEAEVEDLIKA